ncbi:MAG: leucyl/phenylalanyl-tRNA--protein transferase [Bacteroidota bacterium]
MPVFWLSENELTFPHPELANEDGIVAIGGDLSVERLLLAYQMGLFPWFNPEDPILWWSPDPRFVLFPSELKVSKSMRPYFNQQKFQITFDQAFEEVIRGCQQQKRKGQVQGTWISDSMVQAYCDLHEAGYAHSVEVYQDGEIVAGLYGVSLGKVYFGESMFTRTSNASKFGFISLIRKLHDMGFWLIDCQQHTRHLESMGGRPISRELFLQYMNRNRHEKSMTGNWNSLLQS